MSLATRLLALAGALGADYKAINLAKANKNEIDRWKSVVTSMNVAHSYSASALSYFNGYCPTVCTLSFANAGAGGWIVFRGNISPGTWNLRYWYAKLTNLGIVKLEYSFNEGSSWTEAFNSLDCYAAVATYYQTRDVAGIVCPAGKNTILIKVTVTGKNASSSAYIGVFGEVHLDRTA